MLEKNEKNKKKHTNKNSPFVFVFQIFSPPRFLSMSARALVDLYIANDLEELNKRVDENPMIEKAKASTVANLSKVIDSTWNEAKKAESSCDEERAYILYMRTFECFRSLTKARDVATNKVKGYSIGEVISNV